MKYCREHHDASKSSSANICLLPPLPPSSLLSRVVVNCFVICLHTQLKCYQLFVCTLCFLYGVKSHKKDGEDAEEENSHKFSSKSASFSTSYSRETETETKMQMKLEDRDKSRAALNIIACSEAFVRKSL